MNCGTTKIPLHLVTQSGFFYKGKLLRIEEIISRVKEFGCDDTEVIAKHPVLK